MFSWFHPSFDGVWQTERVAEDFSNRLAQRVKTGLFPSARAIRNRYELVGHSDDLVHFRSTTILTGANVGFNDVEVRVDRSKNQLRYSVTYWTWARYCVFLGLGLALAIPAVVFGPGLIGLELPQNWLPEPKQFLVFGVPMIVFWCLIWPWVLIALHKPNARRGFELLLEEVNSGID